MIWMFKLKTSKDNAFVFIMIKQDIVKGVMPKFSAVYIRGHNHILGGRKRNEETRLIYVNEYDIFTCGMR